MNTLEADSINLSFGKRTILANVYLKSQQGEIASIIGRNGCGKSTLMKVIFGTLKGENQSIRVNRQFIASPYRKSQTISYLPQNGLIMSYLTPKRLSEIFRAPEILDIDMIQRSQNRKIGSLSGGSRKLIEIMTMLYTPSMFTLLDEPFSFLSPLMVEITTEHLIRQKQNKGIIITDHQIETVWDVATSNYLLFNGSLRPISHKSDLVSFGYLSKLSNTKTKA